VHIPDASVLLYNGATMNRANHTITLSDPGTKAQFNKDKTSFKIEHKYEFDDTVGYVLEEKKGIKLMLSINKPKEDSIAAIYYLDVSGNLKDNGELLPLVDERGQDLADAVEATLELDGGNIKPIIWHKVSQTILISGRGITRIAEYDTRVNKLLYNLCYIIWKGNNKTGSIEVWYGQNIKKSEYEIKN